MAATPDCLTCGACCASPFLGEGYIQLEAVEEHRLARRGLPVLVVLPGPDPERVAMLGTRLNGQGVRVCVSLRGKVGEQVSCGIYPERPVLCRQFEAGSPECHQARKALGMS